MVDSTILGIPQVAPNQNNKETTINDGISIIERSLNDTYVATPGTDLTITATNFRRHQVMKITPSVGSLFVYVPVQKRFFAVHNDSGTHSFTLRRVGEGSGGIVVAANSYVMCYQDGTNPIIKIADSAAAAFASTFLTLSDAPADYDTHALDLVRVNAAEDALEFWTFEADVLSLTDTPDTYTPLQYLRVNAAGTAFEYVSANPGGETEFILLTDVPLNYDDAAGFFVKVKGTEDGLEFVDGAGLFDFTDLGDVPGSYSGEAGKLVAVTAGADGLEFVDFPSFGNQITLTLTTLNDGFEGGLVAPWETDDDADLLFYTVDSAIGAFGPGAGSLSLVVDSDAMSTAINCTLDLTAYADAAALDNSARITVPYMFIDTLSNGTVGTVEVECLSASLVVLGTLTSGTITGAGVWTSGSVVGNLPTGTRSIRIVVTTDGGGDPILAGWDNFVCQLRITEAIAFIELPDAPSSYAGHAGKAVLVNDDEDAVEFGFIPVTSISGMPASLTGEAGKALVVNPGGTAFILEELVPAYDNTVALYVLRVNSAGTGLEWVAGAGGGVSDGDKGDITVSGSGVTWTIDNGVVSLAKMADMATASLLGRDTAGTGAPEVLSASTVRSLLSLTDENIQDMLSSFLVAGTGITLTYNDGANTLTITASGSAPTESIIIAAGDETTALSTGTAKVTFRMPYAFTLTGIRASLTTAQTSGSILTVDVNEGGLSILSTKLTIDNTEKTSVTAATAAVISDAALADDAEITIDIDQIGDGTAKGLKVILIGHQ